MTTVWQALVSRRMLVTFFLGFSSGLPLLATGGTLQAWMKEVHVDLSIIGLFALVGLPYTLKFLWAPLIDRFTLPFLGRRRGWMLVTQAAVCLSLIALGYSSPGKAPLLTALCALLVTFSSASQDIVLDAHRRDTLQDEELGFGSSLFINGYRVGMLISGACALFLADHLPWNVVYTIIALSMGVGMCATLLAPEPVSDIPPPRSLRDAVVLPFLDYFKREGALITLTFILLYKIGDTLASSMTTPCFLELGFSKSEIASVVKTFGLVAILSGGLLGGALMIRIGINKALWVFGFLQAVTILAFSWLASVGHELTALTMAVLLENFTSGMGTAGYAAFMASLCNRRFSATQYALLSSLMGIPRVLVATPTGYVAQAVGWEWYFALCAFAAIPGMMLLVKVAPWNGKSK